MTTTDTSPDRTGEWNDLRRRYLTPRGTGPGSTARGIHHTAVLSSDVERTIRFHTEVMGFPLIELFENRDAPGSTHFFFDVGSGNTLAYFDFPGLDLGPYAEVLGGLHHVAISMDRPSYDACRQRLIDHGVELIEPPVEVPDATYFLGPDGERLEILTFPLMNLYEEPE